MGKLRGHINITQGQMTSNKLEIIIQKYNRGTLTTDELDMLFEALSEDWSRKQIEKSIEIEYLLSLKYQKVNAAEAYEAFLSKTRQDRNRNIVKKKKKYVAFYRYAAIFVGLFALSYYFLTRGPVEPPLLKIEDKAITLQLGNGKIRVVDAEGNAQVLDKNGKAIATQTGDKITYTSKEDNNELIYNELNIPYGKKFQLELSDGTVVHLNSGSSLRYPVNFLEGKNREVFLNGEAYFKVTEDEAHPFIINTQQVNVRVLGTEFNVSSYNDDEHVNTVLVSGSVELYEGSEANIDNALQLTPTQKGTWNKAEKTFGVEQVDTNLYTAWVDGRLVFRDTPFKTIRKKLERHYNVTINNNNKLLDENTFNAVFDIETIEEVLEVFDRNFGIKYRIEDNQIIIYQQ